MKSLWTLLYIFLLLSQIVICYLQPYHNWDMLGYMGCVISMEEKNIDSIHTKTYRAAQLELPSKDFVTLTESNDYRQKNFSDASFFYSRLKLYWVKPLYVFLIFIIYKLGIPLTIATLIPSCLSLFCMALLLLFWIRTYLPPMYATIIASLIMLSPPFWDAGRYATPDPLAGIIVFSAFYFLIERQKSSVALLLMLVAILIRIDLALLSMMMIGFMILPVNKEFRISSLTAFIFATLVIVMVVSISFFTGNFGESVTEYYNFAEATSDTAKNYLTKLVEILPQLRYSHITFFIALFMIASIKKIRNKSWQNDTALQLSLVLLIYIMIRYLIYPGLEDRFYLAIYLFLFVVAVKEIVGKQPIEI